ncbi:DEAD/DEAH box helicase [Rhizobium sp. BK176]|uniref:DEAD/DEAH box helicase n=1 Tax=Rhizobium sp. BK176 TaxID=2587071 RepID=UPI0021686A12|nr:DEAD/DEAH box helicase [Rhizobium sp. BK176]MCS4089024.1 ATP-dependent Lhr-like helicase [Rhizobium sp. BK176]
METSRQSASDVSSFEKLHSKVRRWIYDQGWSQLRDVQDRTIPSIMDRDGDTLVIAGTASGKTEAAFLPVLSLVADREEDGISVLYVSPLKALINDQFGRLEQLCEAMELNVVRWHGDAPQSAKQALVRNPQGIALITPESIEALLVRRPERARALFRDIDFIVVDEVHAFLHSVRGLHLRSLLRRVAAISKKRPRIVGLSATIGDPQVAASWINPEAPDSVDVVVSTAGNPEVKLAVRAYVDAEDLLDPDQLESDEIVEGEASKQKVALDYIADDIFGAAKGHNNLVFAGSRRRVEALTDRLRRRAEKLGMPNEFFAHHGSVSKELREPLEKRLKAGNLPTTGVATTTLELGIDVGSIRTVFQIGAPRSMSSLKQRLGRSGRRDGMSAILRMFIRERRVSAKTHPLDRLRLDIVAAVASIVLLGRKYVEKPGTPAGAATVALQQTLSTIAERGGTTVADLYQTICAVGPLSVIPQSDYVALLRHMMRTEKLIEQAPDGTVMLGAKGERITGAKDFFAIFETDEEWRVVADGKSIGTLPMTNMAKAGSYIAFAGQRWKIETVDLNSKVVEVTKATGAKMPSFEPLGREGISDVFAQAMLEVLRSRDLPPYLDDKAKELLTEGRNTFDIHGLDGKVFWEEGGGVSVLTWAGTETNRMLALILKYAGLDAGSHDIGVSVAGCSADMVEAALRGMVTKPPLATAVVKMVDDLQTSKYDALVPHEVLESQWIKQHAKPYAEALAIALKLAVASQAEPTLKEA